MFSISIIHGLNLAQNWTKPYWDSTTSVIHSNVPYLIWTSKRWWGHQTRYSSTASAACKWHEFSALIELNIRFACPPSFFSRWSNFNLMRLWNKKTQCLRFYLALVHEKMLMNVFVPQFSQRKILIDKFLCKSCVTHQKKMNDRKSHQGFDFIDLLINFATCCENPPKFITTYLLLLLSFKMRIVLECINEKREQSIVDFFPGKISLCNLGQTVHINANFASRCRM